LLPYAAGALAAMTFSYNWNMMPVMERSQAPFDRARSFYALEQNIPLPTRARDYSFLGRTLKFLPMGGLKGYPSSGPLNDAEVFAFWSKYVERIGEKGYAMPLEQALQQYLVHRNSGRPLSAYLTDGWLPNYWELSYAEAAGDLRGGASMGSPWAGMLFAFDDEPEDRGDKWLQLELSAYVVSQHPSQRYRVYVNGQEVKDFERTFPESRFLLDVPLDESAAFAVGGKKVFYVELESLNPLEFSDRPYYLGLALSGFSVRSAF
jgi:hypothetical protein